MSPEELEQLARQYAVKHIGQEYANTPQAERLMLPYMDGFRKALDIVWNRMSPAERSRSLMSCFMDLIKEQDGKTTFL